MPPSPHMPPMMAVQSLQGAPAMPHAVSVFPLVQMPFGWQQPAHETAHRAGPQSAPLQVIPDPVQSVQIAPRYPQALSDVPALQTPVVSQQPRQDLAQLWGPPLADPPLLVALPPEPPPLLEGPALDPPLPDPLLLPAEPSLTFPPSFIPPGSTTARPPHPTTSMIVTRSVPITA